MTAPTCFIDTTAVAARTSEVSGADWDNGVNAAASNAPGIGINAGGGAVVGTPNQFTLLDQTGTARTPQDSSQIGGDALPVAALTNSASGDGKPSATADVSLVTLAAGWTSTIPAPTAVAVEAPEAPVAKQSKSKSKK
jgi:hypothetical protein